MIKALKGKKAIGVIDRSVSFGWKYGPMCMELKVLGQALGQVPILSYIDGLANLDITIAHVSRVVDEVNAAAKGKPYQDVTWIPMEE
jgi:pyruvate/2-oxoacid:ferredoxin oxidoreductase alpha subunit